MIIKKLLSIVVTLMLISGGLLVKSGNGVSMNLESQLMETTHIVNPGESIQEAIDDAEEGDIIQVMNGVYREDVVVDKRLELIGESTENTIIDAMGGDFAVLITANATYMSGFTLINATNDDPGAGIIMINPAGEGSPPPTYPLVDCIIEEVNAVGNLNGLLMLDVHDTEIKNSTFSYNQEDGITAYGTTNNLIIDNEFSHNSHGLFLDGQMSLSYSNNVSKNLFFNNTGPGIYASFSSLDTFYRNEIYNNSRGFFIYLCTETVLRENIVYMNRDNGIYDYVSMRSELEGNIVYDNRKSGIFLFQSEYVLISGGVIYDNNQDGHGNNGGISLYYTHNSTIQGVYMHDNTVTAINVQDSDNLTISDNRIDHNCGGDAGISLLRSKDAVIEYNDVTNGTGVGIMVEHSTGIIVNNNIRNNTFDGISLWSSKFHLENNDICYNRAEGVYAIHSENTTFIDNRIWNNSQSGIYLIHSDDVSIIGGEIYGNNQNSDFDIGGITGNNANRLTIEDVHMYDNHMASIDVRGSHNLTITGNTIECIDVDSTGISLLDTVDVMILNNHIHDGIGMGISVHHSTGWILENDIHNKLDGIQLQHSVFHVEDNDIYDNLGYGIYGWDAWNSDMVNNRIWNNRGSGIFLLVSNDVSIVGGVIHDNNLDSHFSGGGISASSSDRLHIQGVYMHDNTVAAVNVEQSNNLTIYDNNIDENCGGTAGIYLRSSLDALIQNNRVTNGTGEGIFIVQTTGSIVDNDIRYNQGTGIYVDRSNFTIENNDVSNNAGHGIYLRESDHSSVNDNRISSNTLNGIDLSLSDGNTITHNTIWNNTHGIDSFESWYSVIDENEIFENERGIFLWEEDDYNTVSNNVIYDNDYGIYLDDSFFNEIFGNRVYDNSDWGIYVTVSINNVIYQNRFENENNAYDDMTNDWNHTDPQVDPDGKGGNYWSDYDEGEDRGDGIGDQPYDKIAGGDNQDHLPWVNPVMSVTAASFNISADDITAGANLVIEIYNGTDVNGNPMEGWYDARISDGGAFTDDEIFFENGNATYQWWTFTAAGEYTVSVTIDEVVEEDNFRVNPGYATMVIISPEEDQTVEAGEDLHFSAHARDTHGNLITDDVTEFTWQNAVDGLFNKETVGEYDVTATYDDKTSDITTVSVTSTDVTEFRVSVSDVIAGQEPVIVISDAKDSYGNFLQGDYSGSIEITDTKNLNFTFVGGIYEYVWDTIDTSGEYMVNVTIQEIVQQSSFKVNPGDVDYLEIAPHQSVIYAGYSQSYTAFGYDEYDNEIGEVTADTNWDIDLDAGGSWTDNVYNSENAGTWTVTGTYGGVTDEATLVVEIEETKFVPENILLDVDPTSGEAPLEVTISVSAENTGDGAGSIDVIVDGTVEYTLNLPAGEAADHTFTHTFNELGIYFIEFHDLTETVDVYDPTGFAPVNRELDVTPTLGEPPLTVTIFVSAENVGEEAGSIDVIVDGAVEYSLELPAGQSADHEFTHTFGEVGEYVIQFAHLTETVIVQDDIATYTLTVDIDGDGTVERDPDQEEYEEGTIVTLTATPDDGWEFVEWTGHASGSATSIEVTITEDMVVTAVFAEEDEVPPDDDDDETGIMDLLSDYWWMLLALVILVILIMVLVLMRGNKSQRFEDPYPQTSEEGSYLEPEGPSIEETVEDVDDIELSDSEIEEES